MTAQEPSSDALVTGSRGAALQALRARLVGALNEAEPREVAAIARQLTIVLEQIASLGGEEANPLDDLAARRAARRAGAAGR